MSVETTDLNNNRSTRKVQVSLSADLRTSLARTSSFLHRSCSELFMKESRSSLDCSVLSLRLSLSLLLVILLVILLAIFSKRVSLYAQLLTASTGTSSRHRILFMRFSSTFLGQETVMVSPYSTFARNGILILSLSCNCAK